MVRLGPWLAGERAGGEFFDEVFGVCAEALEYGDEGCVGGAGDHVVGVLAGLEEDGHDDARGLLGPVEVGAQCAADVLDDFDLGSAGVGEGPAFPGRILLARLLLLFRGRAGRAVTNELAVPCTGTLGPDRRPDRPQGANVCAHLGVSAKNSAKQLLLDQLVRLGEGG